jgi:hypothetical protein
LVTNQNYIKYYMHTVKHNCDGILMLQNSTLKTAKTTRSGYN